MEVETKKEEKPKKSKACCWWAALIIILLIGGFIAFQAWPQNYTTKSPQRNYQIPAPSSEALNRHLDCMDFRTFSFNKDKYQPACFNLYKVTEAEINAANISGKYNRILVYGENATFSFSAPMQIKKVDNFGKSFLQVAKFNDLISIPKLMEYYSLDSLDYIPKELSPYPAISLLFADQNGIKEECGAYVAGCAMLNFGTVIKDSFLADPNDSGGLFTKANGDELEYEYNWPSNCYANTTIMHEAGHNFLIANKIVVKGMSTAGWIVAPSYFNENLTEIMTTYLSEDVCGSGTVKVVKNVIEGKPSVGGIIEFNGSFPPTIMHPTSFPKDNECEQAIISSFSHYLMKGEFKTQFPKFIVAFREAMKSQEKYDAYKDDRLMANFMVKMVSPDEKEFLNSHGCGI